MFAVLAFFAVAGCAAMGAHDGERRIVGTIDQAQKATRVREPPDALLSFGLIGALMHRSADRLPSTNLYVVKTEKGDLVMAQVDEEFMIGECVEVIVQKGSKGVNTFSYGDARVISSNRCRKSG